MVSVDLVYLGDLISSGYINLFYMGSFIYLLNHILRLCSLVCGFQEVYKDPSCVEAY